MRYNLFLGNHLISAIKGFFNETLKADIYLKKYFRSTNLGKRDRTWVRERFFFYIRHRYYFDFISETRSDLSKVISMTYDNEPDPSLQITVDEIKTSGQYELLFDQSFPTFLVQKIRNLYGNKFFKWFNSQGETVLRTNSNKISRSELASKLQKLGFETNLTEISPSGIIIENSSQGLLNLPLFKEGFFEFQDESSQIVCLLTNKNSTSFFDCCSGGGGKSLGVASFFPNLKITATDIRNYLFDEITNRAKRAGANINTIDYIKSEKLLFDTVFIDAPCSGSGVLRRNPADRYTIDENLLNELPVIQQDILLKHSENVAPNGEMIYITCSFLKEENESVVEKFINSNKNFSIVPAKKRLLENLNFAGDFHNVTQGDFFRVSPGGKRDILFGAVLKKCS